MHIEILRNLCSENHLPLSLLTHSLQRILEYSVHSKQYKQTTINNNPTNNKTNTTSNMDNNKTTRLMVQVHHIIQYTKRIIIMRSGLVKVQGLQCEYWSNCKLGQSLQNKSLKDFKPISACLWWNGSTKMVFGSTGQRTKF